MQKNNRAIVVGDVKKSFGKLVALNSLSFDVNYGDFFGLLGPNGAGKTTMVNMMATITKPSAGKINILGLNTETDSLAIRRKIGLVFQDSALDRQLTVEENLLFAGALHGLNSNFLKTKINEILKLFELNDRKKDVVGTLSGGQRRAIDIARGLIHEPEILFLDEPTIGLDVLTRMNIWRFIHKLQKSRGITVVLTTHYLEEAESCDNVCFIDKGELILNGKPERLINQFNAEILEIESLEIEDIYPDIMAIFGQGKLDYKTAYFKVEKDTKNLINEGLALIKDRFGGKLKRISIRPVNLNDVFIWVTT
jgi:ABC-2 type transport system ATP-binding protein